MCQKEAVMVEAMVDNGTNSTPLASIGTAKI
jgi:hypothetical protein